MWVPGSSDESFDYVFDQSRVAFAEEFLRSLARWEVRFGEKFPGAPFRLSGVNLHSDDVFAGALLRVRLDDGRVRVWRVTAERDRHGCVAVWPD